MQYFNNVWGSGWFIAGVFVLFNFIVQVRLDPVSVSRQNHPHSAPAHGAHRPGLPQLVPSGLILARKQINIAVGCLVFSVLVQVRPGGCSPCRCPASPAVSENSPPDSPVTPAPCHAAIRRWRTVC